MGREQRVRRERGARQPRRGRCARAPVLHDADVVQQKTYLSLEGGFGFIEKRGVGGRVRGRRRRAERGQLALEQRDLPLQRGDARLLRLEHGRQRGARAAARQTGRGQCALQLYLQRPQRVRRRLELLPVTRVGQPPPPPAAARRRRLRSTYNLPTTDVSSPRLAGAAFRSNHSLTL